MSYRVWPGLHKVVIVVEHACDYDPKRILKLTKYQLLVFVVKDCTFDHNNDTETKP